MTVESDCLFCVAGTYSTGLALTAASDCQNCQNNTWSGQIIYSVTVFSLFPKKVEIQALMKFYDLNGDGSICFEEFMTGLR